MSSMLPLMGITVQVADDTGHEFRVECDGQTVAAVWHSDRGEWTVDSVDGPVYRERSREDAIERCKRLAVGLH